ncbi:MAG: flagellar protein FlaG [Spirochaetales bacterium]|nr:flagellar protein FlaG [Spirochaetales bacterium]
MSIEAPRNLTTLTSQEHLVKETNTGQQHEQHLSVQTTKDIEKDANVLTENDLARLIEALEQVISQFNRRLKFDINREINRIVVKVIDKDTDKVIKEIPPAEIQNLILKIREAIGLLFDIEI